MIKKNWFLYSIFKSVQNSLQFKIQNSTFCWKKKTKKLFIIIIMQKSYVLNRSNKQHHFFCRSCQLVRIVWRNGFEITSLAGRAFSHFWFCHRTTHSFWRFWYRHGVSVCRVPLQQIAAPPSPPTLPPRLSDPALACADEPRVDTLTNGVHASERASVAETVGAPFVV